MPDVLAIGNAIVDVQARAGDDTLEREGLVKGSMQLVDAERAEALHRVMTEESMTSGGSAANTAVGVALLGGSAAFVGKVRDDDLGRLYRDDLRAAGVEFDVAPAPGTAPDPTGRCLIFITPDAERTMNTNLGIAGQVGVADIDEGLVAASGHLYIEGYSWDAPGLQAAALRAIEIARAAGVTVAFSLSDGFCVDRYRDHFLDLLGSGRVDVLFANEDEICSLWSVDHVDDAVQRLRGAGTLAFVTRSEHGSVAVRGEEIHVIEAFPAKEVVDTTGAGDLYAAGALRGLTAGLDLASCARLGSLAAAEIISHIGARPKSDLLALARGAGLLP